MIVSIPILSAASAGLEPCGPCVSATVSRTVRGTDWFRKPRIDGLLIEGRKTTERFELPQACQRSILLAYPHTSNNSSWQLFWCANGKTLAGQGPASGTDPPD